jgi:DNA end-binding protein Ku
MPARPIGSATVSFGHASVPVQLYSAAESAVRVSFNWLHKDCGARLRQQYLCKQDGELVDRDGMIKGYEFAKGQYVTFTPDELKALEEKRSETIEITEFVPASKVGRQYLDKIYYLGPDEGGERAYRLLNRAMQATGLSALAKYAARGKQYLVMVRPQDDGLVMEQLHYADEIRSFSELQIPEGEAELEELQLAIQLVRQVASDTFRPERYRDEVRERMLAQIRRKVEGEEITTGPAEEPKTEIIDLMEALKASLAPDEPPDDDVKPTKRKRAGGDR